MVARSDGCWTQTERLLNFQRPHPKFPEHTGERNESANIKLIWGIHSWSALSKPQPWISDLRRLRRKPNDNIFSLEMGPDNSRPLLVGMQKITAEKTQDEIVNLLPTGTLNFIDSTLPHIWLPNNAIEAFVSAFGLSYDNTTDLYLINETMRARNLELSPTITFTFGKSAREDGTETTNIVLPYAAFDMTASYPFYQTETPYFPIRRAANDSQYTIGRTLFQEAYVIADFERNNFTIGQTAFDNLDSKAIRAIEKPVAGSINAPRTIKISRPL